MPEPAVPYADLPALFRAQRREFMAAIERVGEHSVFSSGPEVDSFEAAFAAYCGARHAIGVSSGTSALHLALLAAGVGPGDEVITVPMTFVATVAAIRYTGARPVFVDIDPRTFTLDPEALDAAVTGRTRAVVPVHLYGQVADRDPIVRVARAHGLAVVEDAAQAHGARYRGRHAGTIGDVGCFSFYPGKNLGAFGEAGMVVTNDAAIDAVVRTARSWGEVHGKRGPLPGYNYRMDAVQAAVLGVKLARLTEETERRRAVAARYDHALRGTGVTPPEISNRGDHAVHVYAAQVADRDRVRQSLLARGIESRVHYPAPVHLMPAYADLGYGRGQFPVSEALARRELSLPVFPGITAVQMDRVVRALVEVTGRSR